MYSWFFVCRLGCPYIGKAFAEASVVGVKIQLYLLIFKVMGQGSVQRVCGTLCRVSFKISENARRAIRLFRVFLLLLAVREERFARRLSTFEPSEPELVIEFDASLSGIGIIWYRLEANGIEVPVGGAAVDLLPLALGIDAFFKIRRNL